MMIDPNTPAQVRAARGSLVEYTRVIGPTRWLLFKRASGSKPLGLFLFER